MISSNYYQHVNMVSRQMIKVDFHQTPFGVRLYNKQHEIN